MDLVKNLSHDRDSALVTSNNELPVGDKSNNRGPTSQRIAVPTSTVMSGGHSRSEISGTPDSHPTAPEFEGESSMTAHAGFANTYIQTSAHLGSLRDFRLEMHDTLKSLRDLVEQKEKLTAGETANVHTITHTEEGMSEYHLPSATVAMASIRLAKGSS